MEKFKVVIWDDRWRSANSYSAQEELSYFSTWESADEAGRQFCEANERYRIEQIDSF